MHATNTEISTHLQNVISEELCGQIYCVHKIHSFESDNLGNRDNNVLASDKRMHGEKKTENQLHGVIDEAAEHYCVHLLMLKVFTSNTYLL